jgi:hypothetical protein
MKVGMVGINNNKFTKMKNWTKYLLVILIPCLSACYDDYIDDYEYSTIYIPYNIDVRTFVVGEGMRIKVGAELGGVRENTTTRKVGFKIDDNLVSPLTLSDMKASSYPYIKNSMGLIDTLKLLPTSYYHLSNENTIEILPGNHTGTIEIKADSAIFLNDKGTLLPRYAIPITLTTAEADRILEGKHTAVIAVKFENMLFGNYLHGGKTTVKDVEGNVLNTQIYNTTISQGPNEIWTLVTSGPNSLTVNGYSNSTSTKPEILLELNGEDIKVGSATDATFKFEGNGESKFNLARSLPERKIFLNYKYSDEEGNTYSAQDTLTFRNRIRDGVNEWQGNGQ